MKMYSLVEYSSLRRFTRHLWITKMYNYFNYFSLMKFFAVVILFAFADAGVITTDRNCITIQNTNYEKEVLKENVNSPYQLTIDYDTNTLFFSYTARSDEMFKIAYLSLKTGAYGTVSGIHGGFANAVNNRGHIVYMGGEDGIYKFDYDAKNATNLHIADNLNVWQMFYNDGLYFTTYPEEHAFIYKDEKVVQVPELKNIKVMLLAVDKNQNFVYSNSSGVFMYNKNKAKTIHVSNLIANGFTADIDGNLYFSTSMGIYYINNKTKVVDELVRLDNIYGVAIEGNGNIIYASEESIVRLKQTKKVCVDENRLVKNAVNLDNI